MPQCFPPAVYQRRIEAAASNAAHTKLNALIFTPGAEFAYLTGSWNSSHERLTALVIPSHGTPFIVAPDVDKTDLALSAIPQLALDVVGWADGQHPHEYVIRRITQELGHDLRAYGVAQTMPAEHLLRFQQLCQESTCVMAARVLSAQFMTKDEYEIKQLRAAGAAIDRVHAAVPDLLLPGRTERDVAKDIEARILAEGHTAVDFVIVGSGENGANPHHSFSDRVLEIGDTVVIDIGGEWGVGYHSDCTRTYLVRGTRREELDAETQRIFSVLEKAQKAAREAVRPGVTAESIDAVAREIITAAGFGDAFFHRTGHGIGLSTHEEPFIMMGNDLVLETGMTFSIEPGIYVEGVGARIEDIVMVTDDGYESFNKLPHTIR